MHEIRCQHQHSLPWDNSRKSILMKISKQHMKTKSTIVNLYCNSVIPTVAHSLQVLTSIIYQEQPSLDTALHSNNPNHHRDTLKALRNFPEQCADLQRLPYQWQLLERSDAAACVRLSGIIITKQLKVKRCFVFKMWDLTSSNIESSNVGCPSE